MKIAIIGGGISGMLAAYLLNRNHNITLFEANDYIGGHTNTIHFSLKGQSYAVDTGFIVFNDKTYPNFIHMLNRLGVDSQPSCMSFSVKCEKTGLEYNGTSLNSLFAQRRNFFKPSFYRMIKDILRFNREAPGLLSEPDNGITLQDYLTSHYYSDEFIQHYLIPMGAAIWSSDPNVTGQFPAKFFIGFFNHHGMLSVNDRPTWRVIQGGSDRYIRVLTHSYQEKIKLNSPVTSIKRFPESVRIRFQETRGTEREESFDHVVMAVHSDTALRMLEDPTEPEREILSTLPYQENEAILHFDSSFLPKRPLAWASWNYHIPWRSKRRVSVTYYMNRLQSLNAPFHFCVTLNPTQPIDTQKIIRRIVYHHPFFSPEGVAAQKRRHEINGIKRTFYCGAYWGNGFHEDGVKSALAVCSHFGERLN